ncbi:MAG: phage portal protein, partial [Sporomusaceae bacterium]|nr:phage portal protein [Sporomusaceae bacterium]
SAVIPTGQASNAKEFVAMHQRLIGAGQGLSYEATSRDMSEVNYSSARQGLLEDQKTYACWQQWLIDHMLTKVYRDVVTAGVLAGELKIPDFFQQPEKYLRHTWIEPGWSWIDPVKEITANTKAIESGQDSLANVCARVGYDWREILEQIAKEKVYIKKLEEQYGITMTGGGAIAAGTKPGAQVGAEP